MKKRNLGPLALVLARSCGGHSCFEINRLKGYNAIIVWRTFLQMPV